MNYNKGFSLLSFSLYLMFFTMISLFSCHIIVSFIIPSLSSVRKCQAIVALHIASDLFVRDIRVLRGGDVDWQVITPRELVWRRADHDIGWCFVDNHLERREGVYNKKWVKKSASVVAAGLSQGMFTVEIVNNNIIGIELALTPVIAHKNPIICYVAVK